MFDDNAAHKILLSGIVASMSFTIFVAGWLFMMVGEVGNDVDQLLDDVGYIKGVISQWNPHPPNP